MIASLQELHETFRILAMGLGFAVIAKPIDLIDENGWIQGALGFVIKYACVLIFSGVVYLSLQINQNLAPHFIALFFFWILNGKLNYPSHVLFAFIPALIMGRYLTMQYLLLALAGLAVYGILELLVKRSKSRLIHLLLYKSLARFIIVPLGMGIYLSDLTPVIYSIPGLLSMHLVRYLIHANIIKIKEGGRT